MAINAKDFTFCDKKLSDFGFIIANFDSSPSDDGASCGNVDLITARPPLNTKNIIHGVTYGEPIKLTFQVLKFDFNLCKSSDTPVTDKEYEELMRWLVRKTYNYMNFDESDIYFNVTMAVTPKKVNGKIFGFEITATNDSVYSYSKPYSYYYSAGVHKFTDESSVIGYIYPKLEIEVIHDGEIRIETNDDKRMIISNCTAGEIIKADCEHGIIESSLPNHNLSQDFNFEFIRFYNTYETRENIINIVNATITSMKGRYTRMVVI